jgi:FkbM family methyltransferase
MLASRGVIRPTYVDIGAHEPVIGNNTFWFYRAGGDGVLIEPNPVYAQKLRAARPRDTVLDVGIGVSDVEEADYFVLDGDGQLNTFSKKQADTMVAVHHKKIVKTMKRKLVKLSEVLEANFKRGSPHVISIDAEGMDLDILKSIDWKRWRPMLVCAETADPETGKVEREIVDFMASQGYTARGGSYINTIFLDNEAPPPSSGP